MQSIEIFLAFVGLFAAAYWAVVKSKWKGQYRIACAIGSGFLARGMYNMFNGGIVAQDQALVVLVFGVGGLVALAAVAAKFWKTDWQQLAIGAVLVIMSAIMVGTFLMARPVTLPTIAPPAAPIGTPTISTPSAPSAYPAPAPSRASSPVRHRTPTAEDCAGYTDDLKAALGCP